MQQIRPTDDDIAELVSFLPLLEADDFVAIRTWHGGEKDENGVYTFAWPEYDVVVTRFFSVAAKACWSDAQYQSHDPAAKLQQPGFIENANLAELKSLLTFCVRGERFFDGHWGSVIEAGDVQRILRRLVALQQRSD